MDCLGEHPLGVIPTWETTGSGVCCAASPLNPGPMGSMAVRGVSFRRKPRSAPRLKAFRVRDMTTKPAVLRALSSEFLHSLGHQSLHKSRRFSRSLQKERLALFKEKKKNSMFKKKDKALLQEITTLLAYSGCEIMLLAMRLGCSISVSINFLSPG